MKAVAPLTGVLERIYAPEPDTQAWLEGIRRAALGAFAGHLDASAYLVRVGARSAEVEAVAAAPSVRDALVDSHRRADSSTVTSFRQSGPVYRATSALRTNHPELLLANDVGVPDVLSSFGFADHERACVVAFAVRRRQRLSRAARVALARISAHLAASYRLRLTASAADEAVLTPEGALLDASGDAKDRGSRERLRQAAIDIARAKHESARDPAASLAFWTAMVDGRWTLVERVDTDGKRLVLAKRNPPESIASRALTERERSVVERASLGGSLRHVAYELGLADSTVSETLARALKKLGIRTRAELVELRASL